MAWDFPEPERPVRIMNGSPLAVLIFPFAFLLFTFYFSLSPCHPVKKYAVYGGSCRSNAADQQAVLTLR